MDKNLTYTRCGDYSIPNIKLSYTEPIEWNRFFRMARTDLRKHHILSVSKAVYLLRSAAYFSSGR